MPKRVTITYVDDRFSDGLEKSDCVDLVDTFIAENVLDLRDKHIRQLSVVVDELAPAG